MTAPLLSVLTTSYNREDFIKEAIESVLASSFTNFEYIINDDGSKDNTVEIAKGYAKLDSRIQVYTNEKNLGDYNNRNKTATYAIGKYIKFVDSDDIIYQHGLQAMVYSMEQFTEAGFGLSAKGDPRQPYPAVLSPRQAYLEHFFGYGHFHRSPGSVIIKRQAFEKVGGFSGQRMIGDTEMWFRLGRHFPLVKFPPDLYWARMHESQESKSDYAQKQYELLHKKVLADVFAHEQCPLTKEEKEKIVSGFRKTKWKQSILKYLPV